MVADSPQHQNWHTPKQKFSRKQKKTMIATKSIEDMKKKNNKAILNVYHMYQGKKMKERLALFIIPKKLGQRQTQQSLG